MRESEIFDALGRGAVLVACTTDGAPNFIGIGESYIDRPSIELRNGDARKAWVASLVRVATEAEELAFWRERAIEAERKLRERA